MAELQAIVDFSKLVAAQNRKTHCLSHFPMQAFQAGKFCLMMALGFQLALEGAHLQSNLRSLRWGSRIFPPQSCTPVQLRAPSLPVSILEVSKPPA